MLNILRKPSPLIWLLLLAVVTVILGYQVLVGQQPPNMDLKEVLRQSDEAADSQIEMPEMVVYYSKSAGTDAITEAITLPWPTSDAQGKSTSASSAVSSSMVMKRERLKQAVTRLIKGPTLKEKAQGYYSEIPPGTKLLGVEETEKAFTVNLSKAFTQGGGVNSMKQRLAELTNTVKAVSQKKPVYVTIEGERLSLLGGEGIEVSQPLNQPGGNDPR